VTQPGEHDAGWPASEDMELLRQWAGLQSGFRKLTNQLLDDVEAKAGVSPSSFQVLWFLMTSEGNTARMNQLAQTLDFSTAGTTKVADRLVEAGLIERRASCTDRRVIFATLTEAGLRVGLASATALAQSLRDRAVGVLGAEQFSTIAATLGALDPEAGAGC
jgi:DNA-binding MarR family transcriptional regulator